MNDIEIDHKFSELSMVPHDPYYIYAIAAAIAAMGFSMIFNIQRRLLWVVALGGIIAVCTRNFVNFELGYGPVIGSFMGSFVVSLIAVKAVHWFDVPNPCADDPVCHPDDSGGTDVSFVVRLYQPAWGDWRGNQCFCQRDQFGFDYPVYFFRCCRSEYLCPTLHS